MRSTRVEIDGPNPEGLDRFGRLRNLALELAIQDHPLQDALAQLMRAVEVQSTTGLLGSILLADGPVLRHGAAPSLPEAYNDAIDGISIGPDVGSCGTAAHTGQPVYVNDIDASPLWTDFRILALSHGLRACWSIPIKGGSGEVLGTFAMYHKEPRDPSASDLEIVDLVTRSAALIVDCDLRRPLGS